MNFKKTHVLIGAFIVFWIVFIGWGMLKTSLKLSKEKTTVSTVSKKPAQEEIIPKETETKKTTPAELATPAQGQPILVRAFRVKATDFQDILPVMGTIKGETEIELRFETNGVIKNIYFQEGEKIKKGELVASLDPKDAQLRMTYAENKLSSTQAAYNSAQKRAEVAKKLFEAGALIKSKLEEIELETESNRFQVETARSELQITKNELDKTHIYATKNCVMGTREAEEGEFVITQDKIGSLLEISNVFIDVGIVERDINKVKLGQKAKIYVDAYPNVTFQGIVERIFPIVEGKSRTLTVKIKTPNPEGLLFPGMFSRAEISIVELKNAFIIPTTCLVAGGKGITLVPVIPVESIEKSEETMPTGVVQLRRVNLGYLTSDYAQITKGLIAEDLVIIEAQGELKDNSPVKIVGVEEPSF